MFIISINKIFFYMLEKNNFVTKKVTKPKNSINVKIYFNLINIAIASKIIITPTVINRISKTKIKLESI